MIHLLLHSWIKTPRIGSYLFKGHRLHWAVVFLWFLTPGKRCDSTTTMSFRILSNSLFTNTPAMRCGLLSATEDLRK